MLDMSLVPSLTPEQAEQETNKIVSWLQENISSDMSTFSGVSGGLDSDVIARLLVRAVGKDRVKFVHIIEEGLDKKFTIQARELCDNIDVPLTIVNITGAGDRFAFILKNSDINGGFDNECTVRMLRHYIKIPIFLSYSGDHIIVGCLNKTELFSVFSGWEPMSMNLNPIGHLYKSQVFDLAKYLGTDEKVIKQDVSAGLYPDDKTLYTFATYLVWNKTGFPYCPMGTEQQQKEYQEYCKILNYPLIDTVISLLEKGSDVDTISTLTETSVDLISRFVRHKKNVGDFRKKRPQRKFIS